MCVVLYNLVDFYTPIRSNRMVRTIMVISSLLMHFAFYAPVAHITLARVPPWDPLGCSYVSSMLSLLGTSKVGSALYQLA